MSFEACSTMRQLEERQLESQVRLLLWSPKMDILALALQNGEIALYRLNWQKIWAKPPPAEGSCCSYLAWRPDGKVLSAGYTSGHLIILDVDGGQSIYTNMVEGEVSSLSWINCNTESKSSAAAPVAQGAEEDASARVAPEGENVWGFLTKFPLLSKAYSSNMDIVEETADCQTLHDGSPPSMLVAGTEQGQVYVFMDGYLLCGHINLNILMNGKCTIQQVSLASNLSTFSILCAACDPTNSSSSNEEEVKLVILSMPLVSSCFQELRALSIKFSILQGTLGYLNETLKQISEAWEGIVVELDAKLESLASRLPEGAMAADFLELLMFGTPSPELEHFLLQELTEKGLKKLIGSIDASYLNIQRLLLKYLHVVAQSLNYFLSEMEGLALATDKLEILGLTTDKIGEAQKRAASFWCKGIELQQVIDESRKNFRVFFRWLHGEILKLSDETVPEALSKVSQQEINFIAEFLSNFDNEEEVSEDSNMMTEDDGNSKKFTHKHLEKVGQYLRTVDLEQPVSRKGNPWYSFLDSNPEIKELDYIIRVNEKTTLFQEHESMRNAICDIFISMHTEMTDKCQYLGELRLGFQSFSSFQLCCRQFESEEHKNKVAGLVTLASKVFDHGHLDDVAMAQQLFYYELLADDDDAIHHNLKAVWIRFDNSPEDAPSLRLVDSHFYTSDTISLFLGHSPVSDNQRIIQLSLDQVKPYLKDVQVSSFQAINLRALAPDPLNAVSIFSVADQSCHRELENMAACQFSVSGPRKVAAFLFRNKKRIRIYDMEVEVDEEEEETVGTSEFSSELNTST